MSGHGGDLRTVFTVLHVPYEAAAEGEWVTTEADDSTVVLKHRVIHSDALDLVPNVMGMGLRDALYILENRGLRVRVQGSGMVRRQSLSPGTRARQGSTILIELT